MDMIQFYLQVVNSACTNGRTLRGVDTVKWLEDGNEQKTELDGAGAERLDKVCCANNYWG